MTIVLQALPPQPASTTPIDISFTDGTTNVTISALFGDVFICSGGARHATRRRQIGVVTPPNSR